MMFPRLLDIGVPGGLLGLVLVLLCPAVSALAAESRIEFAINAEMLSSDNINRSAVGSEEGGEIFSYYYGPEIHLLWPRRTLDLTVLGGLEKIESDMTDETTNTYDAAARYRTEGLYGRYLGLTASATRNTTLAGPDELNRKRMLRENQIMGLSTGQEKKATFLWSLSGEKSRVKSEDGRSGETFIGVAATWGLSPVSKIGLKSSVGSGEEVASENRWDSSTTEVTLTRRRSQRTTYGFGLNWMKSKSDPGGGTTTRVLNLGGKAFITSNLSQRDTFEGQAGYETISVNGGDDEGSYTAESDYTRELSERAKVVARGRHGLLRFTETDGTLSWNRQTILSGELSWEVATHLTFKGETQFTEDELLADAVTGERNDKSRLAVLGAVWAISSSLEFTIEARRESTDSSDPAYDFRESRASASIAGVF